MIRVNGIQCLLLALILAVSVEVLSLHSAKHANGGIDRCLMCASHADSVSAPLPQAPFAGHHVQARLLSLVSRAAVRSHVLTDQHGSRAPPAIS